MKNSIDIIEKLKKNDFFKCLSNSEIENIISEVRYSLKSYKKGQVIANEGEECNSLGLVVDGTIEIQRIYSSGKYIVLKRLGSSEVFGEAIMFSNRNKYPATIISLTNSNIAYIKKEDIIKLCLIEETLLKNFVTLLSDKIFVLNKNIKNISFKTVREKVVNFIVEQMKEQGNQTITLKINKEQIASLIGIPRPSLSRELMKLREEGLIEFNRNTITIINIDELEEQLLD